jgi:hypothetical protein
MAGLRKLELRLQHWCHRPRGKQEQERSSITVRCTYWAERRQAAQETRGIRFAATHDSPSARRDGGVLEAGDNPEGRAQAVPFGNWVWCACFAWPCGVAQLAREPEFRRMVSASDRQSRAAFRPPGHGRLISGGWLRPARTWPCVDNDPKTPRRQTTASRRTAPASARRSATGPFPPPPRLPAGAGRHKGQGFLRWLAWPVIPFRTSRKGIPFRLILLPAEPAGAPPPPSSCRTLRQETGRPSPRLDRHVDGPSGERGWT